MTIRAPKNILQRWRLVLGRDAEKQGITIDPDNAEQGRIAESLEFLFNDGDGDGNAPKRSRRGSTRQGSNSPGRPLNVPTWVAGVNQLFPRQAKEVLEKELIKRRGIEQLLHQPELLEQIEPNLDLVKILLTHKNLLKPRARDLARKIIEKVVLELQQRLKLHIEQAVSGALRRDRHSPRKVFRNLDIKTTLRRNLQNWDEERQQLLVERAYYFAAERKQRPWHMIVAVDQSGSMLDSAIFSAVMASIFYQLPALRTSLFLFDTEVVDLSDQVGQPVDVLLEVQLGGGTDIAQAVRYAQQLVREPQRTIFVLISDFYEGGSERDMVRQVELLAATGARCIGLGALGYDARPDFDRRAAEQLRKVGMDVLACTPEALSESIAHIIRG